MGLFFKIIFDKTIIMSVKTNASRLLEQSQVPHQLHSYPVDESDLSATHLCDVLHIPFEKVYKSIVVEAPHKVYGMGLVPADAEIDLKKMAKLMECKTCSLLPLKDLQSVTGYIRGGCTPIALKKPIQILVNQTALEQETIFISAGKRGMQIEIAPSDLINFVQAKVEDIIKE